MKQNLLLIGLFLLLTAVFTAVANAQTKQLSRTLSIQGDTVWVFVNYIKADKRQQFEKFVHEILWDQSSKLSKEEQKAFRQTRVLHPVAPEADGTWTYLFVVDPKMQGIDYGIEPMLVKMYGNERANELMQLLEETTARDQKRYVTVQSRH